MVSLILPTALQTDPTGVSTQDLPLAKALLYALGYGPSPTYLYTGVVFILRPIWFSSTIGLFEKKTDHFEYRHMG